MWLMPPGGSRTTCMIYLSITCFGCGLDSVLYKSCTSYHKGRLGDPDALQYIVTCPMRDANRHQARKSSGHHRTARADSPRMHRRSCCYHHPGGERPPGHRPPRGLPRLRRRRSRGSRRHRRLLLAPSGHSGQVHQRTYQRGQQKETFTRGTYHSTLDNLDPISVCTPL